MKNPLKLFEELLFNSKSKEEKDLYQSTLERKEEVIKIAFAGRTGAGKSTLINKLFEPTPRLKEGFGKSQTLLPETRKLILSNSKGSIEYTDLPGIGESKVRKQEIEDSVMDEIDKCDLILWLFRCDVYDKEQDEQFFDKLKPEQLKKLVFGLSAIDRADGNWYSKGKEPSEKQKAYIAIRTKDIARTFHIPKEDIIPFSAQKNYNLNILVNTMMLATAGKGDILRYKLTESLF